MDGTMFLISPLLCEAAVQKGELLLSLLAAVTIPKECLG